MQAEERIKELIIAKYGNVRAFATESGISYTTVRSILERGIMNAKAENVFKICHLLGISPTHSLNGVLRTSRNQPMPTISMKL